MNLDDDDGQDLNMSMITDLVTKVLDDDSIIGDSLYGTPSTRYQRDILPSSKTNGFYGNGVALSPPQPPPPQYSYELYNKLTESNHHHHQDYSTICSALNGLSLNTALAAQEKRQAYGNGFGNQPQQSSTMHDR